MLFGVSRAGDRRQKEAAIQLADRIIISPHAARRPGTLLDGVLTECEKRFGTLNLKEPVAATKS